MSSNVDENKIFKIISEQLGVDIEKIEMDSSFEADLGSDSLDLVELILAFEDEFDVKISDEVAETLTTVRKAVDYIKEHSGSGDSAESDAS